MRIADDEVGLFEAIHTQRAIRSFRSDPLPQEVIEKIIESATRAPSGGNSQPWAFIVVRDPAVRAQLAEHARVGFEWMNERASANLKPGDPPAFPRLQLMIEAFERIPAVVIACGVPKPGQATQLAMLGASVYPAVQNLLLAARGLGVGAAITTGWAQPRMAEIKALLGIPEPVVPLAFIPLGYPDKERYGPTTRRPLTEVLHWDRYEEKANTAAMVHR